MGRRRSAAAFAGLGLVGAFLASAIAGVEITRPDPGADRRTGANLPYDEAHTLPEARTIRVEVLNGAGRAGLARDATHRLRGDGFDVVFYGNAGRFDHGTSVVLARTDGLVQARAVAAALGIDSVRAEPDARLLLDATVVLGADWPPPTPGAGQPFDRLRRLLAPADTAP
jgi:hypothetical protein